MRQAAPDFIDEPDAHWNEELTFGVFETKKWAHRLPPVERESVKLCVVGEKTKSS
jgi:hypothetical protein